jgi:hypothetical protein
MKHESPRLLVRLTATDVFIGGPVPPRCPCRAPAAYRSSRCRSDRIPGPRATARLGGARGAHIPTCPPALPPRPQHSEPLLRGHPGGRADGLPRAVPRCCPLSGNRRNRPPRRAKPKLEPTRTGWQSSASAGGPAGYCALQEQPRQPGALRRTALAVQTQAAGPGPRPPVACTFPVARTPACYTHVPVLHVPCCTHGPNSSRWTRRIASQSRAAATGPGLPRPHPN